jgi:hypothetical protein
MNAAGPSAADLAVATYAKTYVLLLLLDDLIQTLTCNRGMNGMKEVPLRQDAVHSLDFTLAQRWVASAAPPRQRSNRRSCHPYRPGRSGRLMLTRVAERWASIARSEMTAAAYPSQALAPSKGPPVVRESTQACNCSR